MSDIFLKPYKPMQRRRTDLLTYIIRFIIGCIFGAFVAAYFTFKFFRRSGQSFALEGIVDYSPQMYLTFISITLFIGILSALFGDKFWGIFSRN